MLIVGSLQIRIRSWSTCHGAIVRARLGFGATAIHNKYPCLFIKEGNRNCPRATLG